MQERQARERHDVEQAEKEAKLDAFMESIAIEELDENAAVDEMVAYSAAADERVRLDWERRSEEGRFPAAHWL